MTAELELGKRLHIFAVALRGRRAVHEWRQLSEDIARVIRMEPVDKPKVWEYPVNGKGGEGQTIIQPITESFIALDVWPKHNGAYLVICSCKPFLSDQLLRFLRRLGFSYTTTIGKRLELLGDIVSE